MWSFLKSLVKPAAPRRNLWVSRREPIATWAADLTELRGEPLRLLEWLAAILDAGEEHRVLDVEQAPSVG